VSKQPEPSFRFSNIPVEKISLRVPKKAEIPTETIDLVDPYQIDDLELIAPITSHKKKKSIFSNEYFSINNKETSRLDHHTPEKFAQTTLIGGMHQVYQTNQMMHSHIGDVDNEPVTPKTPISQINEF